jgi:hypothetical protein
MMWYLCGGCNPVTMDEMLTTMKRFRDDVLARV